MYCEGIFIDGKLHGLARLGIRKESNLMVNYFYGTFRNGIPDGDFIYIDEKSNIWNRLNFVKGTKRPIENDININ